MKLFNNMKKDEIENEIMDESAAEDIEGVKEENGAEEVIEAEETEEVEEVAEAEETEEVEEVAEAGEPEEVEDVVEAEETEEVEEVTETEGTEEVEEVAETEETEEVEEVAETEGTEEVEDIVEAEDSGEVVEEPETMDSEEIEEETDETEEVENEDYQEAYSEEDEAALRRMERRRRRVRNQIISYSVIVVLLAIIGVGAYIGISTLVGVIGAHKAADNEATATEEEQAKDAQEVVIEAPDSVESESQDEETEPEEVAEEIDYLGEAVNTTISAMPIEDKVAQIFITTPEALTGVNAATQAGEGTQNALTTYAVGGLVYSSKNIVDSEQLTELISKTAGMSKYELFFGINEPGGETDVIGNSSIESVPSVDSPATIGESGDSTNAYNAGATIAGILSSYGFNMDFAPNGSIVQDDNSVVKKLSYGADEATVYDMAVQMISGLNSGNVNACMTDFPGLGNITSSTADGVVESEISADELSAQLSPYISGIASGAAMVQVNNVTYVTADDNPVPASLSRYIINTVLRGNMGYDGIVVTGDLAQKAITEKYSAEEAVKLAIAAGTDMIYCSENFEDAYNALLSAVQDNTIPESRIDESLQRIYRVKLADDIE